MIVPQSVLHFMGANCSIMKTTLAQQTDRYSFYQHSKSLKYEVDTNTALKGRKSTFPCIHCSFFINFIWKQCKGIQICTHTITFHIITVAVQGQWPGMEITLTKTDKWFLCLEKLSLLRENEVTPAFCLPDRGNAL